MLTVPEIVAMTGVSESAVWHRIASGRNPVDYVPAPKAPKRPAFSAERIGSSGVRSSALRTAADVVARYRGRIPSIQQLVNDTGMCRATAFRWRGTLIDSWGAQGLAIRCTHQEHP